MTAVQTVVDAIQSISFGKKTTFQNLAIVPILGAGEGQSDYLTLDEALANGSIEVTEVSEAGHVPALKVVVKGAASVLLLDGEELIGAKQNRVLNLTILVPAHHTITIPVSCVESGRWRHVSRNFTSAPRTQFAEGRAARMLQVTASMLSTGERRSDQGEVWHRIAEKSERLNVSSDTAAMSEMFQILNVPLEEFVRAFEPVNRQVGAVFLVNGRPAGLELFDAPATWRKLAPKLIQSYALDALDRAANHQATAMAADVARFAKTITSATSSAFQAVGEGEDVRLSGQGLQGAALVARGRAIHLMAFANYA